MSAKNISPCINQCTLNEKDVCLGCKRTLNEILNWTKLTEEQKLKIMAELKLRKY